MENSRLIDSNYEQFYAKRNGLRVYPTEFVVRIFLASYPGLTFRKPAVGDRVLDIAFGDGRNTVFLCQQGYNVSGIEITQGIVKQTEQRLKNYGLVADLRVGRNSDIPFENEQFDYILACNCCYYCDDNQKFETNLAEYSRVIKPGGWLIASVADCSSYIFKNAKILADGTREIMVDPYENRLGYRLFCAESRVGLTEALSKYFGKIQIGHAANDYFGIDERLFWVVAQKTDKLSENWIKN